VTVTADHQKLTASVNIWIEINYIYTSLTESTRFKASFPGQPGLAGTRKVKPIWMTIYKSFAPCSRQPHQHVIT